MARYDDLKIELRKDPRVWLVTGVGGFIGSNLLEALLKLDQRVIGLDNFSTGRRPNLAEVEGLVSREQWGRFHFIEGDLTNPDACRKACDHVELVLHQAALGSVPRSMVDPIATHESNVSGFLNMLIASRERGVKRFVYASSSAVYGDSPDLPKVENRIGKPLSPYAASKQMNETYAEAFAQAYGTSSIGLRYFNVFGPRQDPAGAYAAVIPKWIASLLKLEPVFINGDGETSRDFCFVDNVVQANLLSAMAPDNAGNQVYNVALGERTTLKELFELIEKCLRKRDPNLPVQKPVHREFRAGDVRHSLADISKAAKLLGYCPTHSIGPGMKLALDWYLRQAR
jgi:UDP-N-acetylglucosamine 4-epimerase